MRRAVRVRIYYEIDEEITEHGDYTIKGEKIRGHRNYYYNSGLWLTWKLPRSKKDLFKALKKWEWESAQIMYDYSKVNLECRKQDSFVDYTMGNDLLTNYERFNGEDATIVTRLRAKAGPKEIKIFFDNGEEIDLKVRSKEWLMQKLEDLLV